MSKLIFRMLNAEEIDVRVGQISEKGASLLLYKDARCDMNILDETVGAMDWKREHTRDNANCVVSIWDEKKGQWISKEDTGTESYTEKEKGIASDSFKRACVNWGIGRELYTAPFIYVKSDKIKLVERNGKWSTFDKFQVAKINYDENRQIIGLVIHNQNGIKVFSYGTFLNQVKSDKIEKEYTCTDCGKSVESGLAQRATKVFGTILCKECGVKRKEKGDNQQ